ncbi:DUF4351 domain-containing protein [Massilia endophytica]|uniref:DUF4351 domain-containing protein n=1 Tax=Massilia endophytica TaxID=2899220 RepID=UPI001E47A04D|nr:DUF4351 domain-containing protein [Massilia endophytica]UGQ45241.1 DUF4351 domain-containing protein [Massilia endophytica]
MLADRGKCWRPRSFGYELLGCSLRLRFAAAKLQDHAKSMDALLGNPNPFALVTAAHLLTGSTRRAPHERYDAKWRLTRLLYERSWDKQRIIDLYKVIDWMMRLPPELEKQLWSRISTFEKESNMGWISNAERFGMEKGLEQGLEQGRREGILAMLTAQLERRFGALSGTVRARLDGASSEQLLQWGARLYDASTPEELFN